MFLVHGNGAEPPLREVTSAFTPRLDDAGIVTIRTRKRAAQPIRIGWHKDEVHVVRHQAPGPHLDPAKHRRY